MTLELLRKTLTATNAENHTHLYIPFTVPEGMKEIRVFMEYAPKFFDDREKSLGIIREVLARDAWYTSFTEEETEEFLPLCNHISVSLDSPAGWLGTAHRHAPKQTYFVNERDAAYGFRPAPAESGEWRLTLSFNCVVTGSVTVDIRVEADDEISQM